MKSQHNYLILPQGYRAGISLIVIALAIALISSCVVNTPTPYYRPEAADGSVVRAMQPRTKSAILFDREGVIIGFNTAYTYEHALSASISFEVPEGKVVQLVEHNLEVQVNSASFNSALSGKIWTGPGRTTNFPLNTPMIGKNAGKKFGTATGFGNTDNAAYFFTASLFTKPAPKAFKIKIPKFLINNTEVDLPIVSLKLDSEDLWTSLP